MINDSILDLKLLTELLGVSKSLPYADTYGYCPFCEKETNNFEINRQNNSYECYSCNATGVLSTLKERILEKFSNNELIAPYLDQQILDEEEPIKEDVVDLEDEQSGLTSFTSLYIKVYPENHWIIEGLIPVQSIVIFSGYPGNFKTWLTLEMLRCIASGKLLFDKFPTHQGSVLLVNEENNDRLIGERGRILQIIQNLPIKLSILNQLKIENPKDYNLIKSWVEKHKIKLVCFDSFKRIHDRDENDSRISVVFQVLRKLIKETGTTVLLIHHHRKELGYGKGNVSHSLRGSSDIFAAVNSHIAVEKVNPTKLRITQSKLWEAEEQKPFEIEIVKDDGTLSFEYLGEVDEDQSRKVDFQKAIQHLLKDEDRPMFKKEIFESLKKVGVVGGYTTFKTAIQEMVDDGQLFTGSGDKNKTLCSLKPLVEA